jgi:hypothetical protein
VLTKHPARMREFFDWAAAQQNGALETCAWEARYIVGNLHASEVWPLENVWLGVTVEDQQRADERIPELLRCPAEKRWLSVEPMLEAIDLTNTDPSATARLHRPCLASVVCGGESAQTRANTRPFEIEWARELLAQCRAAGVPFFMKQLGTVVRIHAIEILSVRPERLDKMLTELTYGMDEVRREGFPEMSPLEFVTMFCATHDTRKARGATIVNRIEFRHL